MSNAKNIPADILINQKHEKYAESIRNFQGCLTIAVTESDIINNNSISVSTISKP